MNAIPKISCAVLLLAMAYSCKKAEESAVDAKSESVEISADNAAISSSAAKVKQGDSRKVIREAVLKMKVKDVTKSTYVIENVVDKFGGFVTYTDLKSVINNQDETRVSQDSVLETTKYTVENDMVIRVPNVRLDTVLQSLRKEIDFLDSRKITQDDVSLQLLANKMAQNRSTNTENRIVKAIDNKGKKLDQIIDGEEILANKKEENDNKTIENLSLNDKINFSTINISLYQREMVKNQLYASEKNINKYRPNLGFQILDSLKSGWFLLEEIIAFIVQLWSLILIGFLGWFGYKKFLKK